MLPCLDLGGRADIWGETSDVENGQSIPFARNHYFTAVAGASPQDRDEALAGLFFSLGHVVHLVQDMAQPEHTRDDPHLDNWAGELVIRARHPSLYEHWGLQHLVPLSSTVPFTGYPTPRLSTYRTYFNDDAFGRGLADFANRSFVTQETNYGDASLPRCFHYHNPVLPHERRVVPTTFHVITGSGGTTTPIVVNETIFTSHPFDDVRGVTDSYHTYLSSIDHELASYSGSRDLRRYSLTDRSYRSRAELLIPRAVAYSAGLVEHMFRGSVVAAWQRSLTNADRYDLTVTNTSSEAIGADMRIAALYRATPAYLGVPAPTDLGQILPDGRVADRVAGFNGLDPGESVTIRDLVPTGLHTGDSLLAFERRIAIRATLGDTPGEVITLVQEPVRGGPLRIVVTGPFLHVNPLFLFSVTGTPNLFARWGCLTEQTLSRFPGAEIIPADYCSNPAYYPDSALAHGTAGHTSPCRPAPPHGDVVRLRGRRPALPRLPRGRAARGFEHVMRMQTIDIVCDANGTCKTQPTTP